MSFKSWVVNFLGLEVKNANFLEENMNTRLQEVYYKDLAFQTAVTLIANAIAKCEIKTFENGKEVKGEKYWELNIEPNANQNSSQLWHKAIEKMYYDNESLIVSISGKLYVADSYAVEEYPILGNTYNGIAIDTLQLNKTFKSNEVIRLQLNDVNIKRIIDGICNEYSELLSYAMKQYKKGNQSKYKLEMDNIKAGDEAFNSLYKEYLQKQLQSFIDADTAVYPQFKGYNLVDITPNNKADSGDFRELRKDMFTIVAQSLQIPLDLMFGDVANMDEVVKVFLTFCIDPIADMISEELTRKIYPGYNSYKKGNYVKVDTSTIKHIDILDVADKVDKLIASGTCCVDETRALVGFNPLNTDFSTTHFMTKNYDTGTNCLKGGNDPTIEEEGGENNE